MPIIFGSCLRHALMLTQYTGGKVAMLLDISSLCSPVRTDWWRETPPARLYAIGALLPLQEDIADIDALLRTILLFHRSRNDAAT